MGICWIATTPRLAALISTDLPTSATASLSLIPKFSASARDFSDWGVEPVPELSLEGDETAASAEVR